jgi:hypothetical protein
MSVGCSIIELTTKGNQMPTYDVEVIVRYNYEVEAENEKEAEEQGWMYEEHNLMAEVYSIEVEEQEEDEEDE